MLFEICISDDGEEVRGEHISLFNCILPDHALSGFLQYRHEWTMANGTVDGPNHGNWTVSEGIHQKMSTTETHTVP